MPKPCVITRLMGGLGNQMFQYAAGRALSLRLDAVLKFDKSWFRKPSGTRRDYELGIFNLQIPEASEDEVEKLVWEGERFWKKFLPGRYRWPRKRATSYKVQPSVEFWPKFNDFQGSCYLYGYWQSERYFKPFSHIIRRDFAFPSNVPNCVAKMARDVCSDNESVCLHFRRGDYFSDPKTNSVHGIDLENYYKRSIKIIASQTYQPHFYLFSDDPDWLKAKFDNFSFKYTIVDFRHKAHFCWDMYIMSMCKYFVVANSSFSWWGAWLAQDTCAKVYAPSRWFLVHSQASDILPPDWEVVDV